jgi:hypothetical protein
MRAVIGNAGTGGVGGVGGNAFGGSVFVGASDHAMAIHCTFINSQANGGGSGTGGTGGTAGASGTSGQGIGGAIYNGGLDTIKLIHDVFTMDTATTSNVDVFGPEKGLKV